MGRNQRAKSERGQKSLAGKKRDHVIIREALDQFCEDVKSSSSEQFETDEIVVKRGNTVDIILEQSQKRNVT
jgi:hypothetical protein